MANELKQAINKVEVEGVLLEKDFEIIDADMELQDKTKVKCKAIKGFVKVQTEEHSQHKLDVFSKSIKKDGTENSIYTGLMTVKNDYKSVADLLLMINPDSITEECPKGVNYTEEDAFKFADKLSVTGAEITLNEYATPTGDWKSYQTLKTNFLGRVKDMASYSPRTKFTIQGVIRGFKDEIDKKTQAPTGRKKIGLLVPVFGGKVIPLEFVADQQNGMYMESAFPKGSTVELWGSLVNNVLTEEKVTEGFGKANVEIIKTYVNEFLVEGGQPQPLVGEKAFDNELVKKAMTEREVYIEQAKEKKKAQGNKPANKPAPQNFDY